MEAKEMIQLQEEANAINQIYDRINEQRNRSTFFAWCKSHSREDLLEQWDFERNLLLGITVHTISRSSDIRPYWFCKKHNQVYRCRVDSKIRGTDVTKCTKCMAEKRRMTKTEKVGSLLEWCQNNGEYGQQLIREWDTEKNRQELGMHMDNINYNSSKTVYWKCPKCNNEWTRSVSARALHKEGSCPKCLIEKKRNKRQETVLKNRNLLVWSQNNGEVGQRLIDEWDTEKNEALLHLTMEQITSSYMQKVHWKCAEGHEFQVTPYYRTYYKRGCPICNYRSRRGKTLQETHSALLKEWDYSKNEKSPRGVSAWSQERVWWKCPGCGHEWQAMISGRAQQATGCPKCHHNWAGE